MGGYPASCQVHGAVLAQDPIERGASKSERALLYGITSLAPADGPPERLLARKRGHWAIENRLHRVEDVTLGEDQSTLRYGQSRPSWPSCATPPSASCAARASTR